MSRIGNAPITVPSGVKVNITDDRVEVEGPKGKLVERAQPNIEIKLDGDTITLERQGDTGPERAMHGLMRSLLANAIPTGSSDSMILLTSSKPYIVATT